MQTTPTLGGYSIQERKPALLIELLQSFLDEQTPCSMPIFLILSSTYFYLGLLAPSHFLAITNPTDHQQ